MRSFIQRFREVSSGSRSALRSRSGTQTLTEVSGESSNDRDQKRSPLSVLPRWDKPTFLSRYCEALTPAADFAVNRSKTQTGTAVAQESNDTDPSKKGLRIFPRSAAAGTATATNVKAEATDRDLKSSSRLIPRI